MFVLLLHRMDASHLSVDVPAEALKERGHGLPLRVNTSFVYAPD